MKRQKHRIALLLMALLTAAFPAHTDPGRKLALVIANSGYQTLGRLKNPLADAQAVAVRLNQAGFELLHPIRSEDVQADLNLAEMLKADEDLLKQAAGAQMVLVYYAGHGLQIDGVPYLVPVDLPAIQPQSLQTATGQDLLKRGLVELDRVIAGLDEQAQVGIAVFDACREIPALEKSYRAAFGDASPFRGLERPKSKGRHRLLAYSASAGELANDGQAGHSPYTQAWLNEFDRQPGKDIVDFFSDVAAQVTDAKGQHPEVVISGIHSKTYYLAQAPDAAPPPVASKPAPPDPAMVELSVWDSVKTSDNPADFEEYLRQYPQGRFAVLAKNKLKRLAIAADLDRPHPNPPPEGEGTKPNPLPAGEVAKPNPLPLGEGRVRVNPALADFGIDMVRIPGGEFSMGSDDSDKDAEPDEKPKHKVNVRAFSLGKYEVTLGQYAAFVKDTGHSSGPFCYVYKDGSSGKQSGADWRKPGFAQDDRHPAVCISLTDALAYIAWLNRKTGQTFRLPTEAEWEYAARAGTQTIRYWGDNPDEACRYANVADQTAKRDVPGWPSSPPTHNCTDGYAYTAPVGSFKPNAFQLFDMLGNVYEWTCSAYEEKYAGGEKTCLSNNNAVARGVIRGGSWGDLPANLRSAYRGWDLRDDRFDTLGFRLAQDF